MSAGWFCDSCGLSSKVYDDAQEVERLRSALKVAEDALGRIAVMASFGLPGDAPMIASEALAKLRGIKS